MSKQKNKPDGVARVKVLGVGGGGCNAVIRMMRERPGSTRFICLNTDEQALASIPQRMRILLGQKMLHGLGAGGDLEQGKRAAEESSREIKALFKDTDMIFITAGMGGGTGTGAAPVMARLAKESGVLTVGIVTRPFFFEGSTKRRLADDGIQLMESNVDSLIIVPNDGLLSMNSQSLSMNKAFKMADSALRQAVFAIADVLECKGDINVDFADVRSVLKDSGRCLFALGQAQRTLASKAAQTAVESPLLETNLNEARKALLVVSGSRRLKLSDVQAASEVVQQALHPEAHIIFGVTTDQSLGDQVRVTLIASTHASKSETVDDILDSVTGQEDSVVDLENNLVNSGSLWDSDEGSGNMVTGVIRELDNDFREITISSDDGDDVTLALTEATQLIKDSCIAGFERLRIGDFIQSASRYNPATGVLDKLVVKRRRNV